MMSPRTVRTSRRGAVLAETCMSLLLVGMLLAMVSVLTIRYARAADYFLCHRRAQLAAESIIDEMRAGEVALEDADVTGELGVDYVIRVTQADEAWAPLRHVTVVATVRGEHSRVARCEVKAYVADSAHPPGGPS